jgi:hypothetical protein
MIVFDFKCANGHSFEEWFATSGEYEARVSAHALTCPKCGDKHVEKGLSAPRINGGAREPSVGPCGMPCGGSGGVCGMAI